MKKMKIYPYPNKGKSRWVLLNLCILMFILMIFPAVVHAQVDPSLKIKSLKLKDVELSEALEKIETLTKYDFIFNYDDVKGHKVTVDLKDVSMEDCLKEVLKDKPFAYKFSNDLVIIMYKTKDNSPLKEAKEKVQITGKVFDQDGLPLPGATILEVGTMNGVTTNPEGMFSLEVVENSSIRISFVGFEPQIVAVADKREINVTLKESTNTLSEVVITGIFTKAKESYTGSVTTIKADEIQALPGQTLLQTLQNIDPAFNIEVDNSLGSNPNQLPQITIRGNSSLPMSVEDYNAGVRTDMNAPLIILDGFEISLTKLMDFNDEDIESISILKDVSATAIYGSRGANGVVVLTSKRPQVGKLRIQAQTEFTFEIPDLTSYDLLSASELLQLQYNLGLYTSANNKTYDEMQQAYEMRLQDVLTGVNTDWLHYPVHTGVGKKYSLRLEGGSEQFRWSTSLLYNNIAGVMKGSGRKNFNGSVMLAYTYKKVTFRNQLIIGINKSSESPYGSFGTYAEMQPYYKPYDEDGKLITDFMGFYLDSDRIQNPLYDASLNIVDDSKYKEIINNFAIEWEITPVVTLLTKLGISDKTIENDYFLPSEHSTFNTLEYETDDGYFRKGLYEYSTGDAVSYEGDVTLSYSSTFNEKHKLYAGINYSMQSSENYLYTFALEGFSAESDAFPGNALQYKENGMPSALQSTTRRVGFTGNVNYIYDERYFIDLSYRADGSSQFGTNNKFAPFWSVGIGWNLHHENFLKNSGVINTLRLKASYGQTGSQQFSAYQALQTYEYYTGDKYLNGSGVSLLALGNENLKWQKTDQFNIGTEVSILNNRLTVEFDYYIKKTSGLLSSMDLPLSTGFDSYIENIGTVKNVGFETSLKAYVIRNKDFTWIVGANLAYNKNEIAELSDAIKAQTEAYKAQDVDVSTLFYEGYAQNSIWAVRSLGIDPSTGNELYLDADDNITDEWQASAKVYCGVSSPRFKGNLNSMFRYKNFSLNLSFAYHWGGQVYNQTLLDKVEVPIRILRAQNVDSRVLSDRWNQPGDVTFFKAFSTNVTRATSRFVMDDNVFQLQSASLEYKLDKAAFLKKYNIQNIRFALNMSDLFYLSSVKRERGTDYPFARRIGLSIAVLF